MEKDIEFRTLKTLIDFKGRMTCEFYHWSKHNITAGAETISNLLQLVCSISSKDIDFVRYKDKTCVYIELTKQIFSHIENVHGIHKGHCRKPRPKCTILSQFWPYKRELCGIRYRGLRQCTRDNIIDCIMMLNYLI